MAKKPKGFFITGTDTDIGKTFVSRLLVNHFSCSRKVTYMKPVQTGCEFDKDGTVKVPDLDYVLPDKTMMSSTLDNHVPYRFKPACSPHLAATLDSQLISLEHIRQCFLPVSSPVDLTIVEGAGGVLAPLSETTFMVDLMVHLQLPVILVTSPHLGTLNHTFLSIKALHHSGVVLAGIVLNNSRNIPKDYLYYDNMRMTMDHTRPVPFLEVSYGEYDEQRLDTFCTQIQNAL